MAARHAFVAPDGHMADEVPGWHGARTTVLVSPRISAAHAPRFVQLLARFAPGGGAEAPAPDVERFVYALDGTVQVNADGNEQELGRDGFAFLPAGRRHEVGSASGATLVAFERRYEPAAGVPEPPVVIGDAADTPAEAFLDLAGVRVRSLLPNDPSFDLSMSVMTYRPGAALPMVETHEAEHGSLHLAGTGVLRLEDAWYPVREGDAVWMGPYCPQWFAAVGEEDASYLLYKDGRRGPWA